MASGLLGGWAHTLCQKQVCLKKPNTARMRLSCSPRGVSGCGACAEGPLLGPSQPWVGGMIPRGGSEGSVSWPYLALAHSGRGTAETRGPGRTEASRTATTSRPRQHLRALPTHLPPPPESGLMPKAPPAAPETVLLMPLPSLQSFPSMARASPAPPGPCLFTTPAALRTRNRNQQCSLAEQAGSQRQGLGAQGRGPAGQAPPLKGGPWELWQGWKEAPPDGQRL